MSILHNKGILSLILFIAIPSYANATDYQSTLAYPCANGSILTYFKRPPVITSACPVPFGMFTIEGGIQYNQLIDNGNGWTYPQSKVRVGLPWRSELSVVLPNEKTDSKKHISGLTFTQLALKHNIAYNNHWNTAIRFDYAPASGSKYYGTQQNGYTLDGILAYTINSISITAMMSVASLSTAKANGGKRYYSINPDVSASSPRAGITTYIPHKLFSFVKILISKTNSADSIQPIPTIYSNLLSGLASAGYRYGNHRNV